MTLHNLVERARAFCTGNSEDERIAAARLAVGELNTLPKIGEARDIISAFVPRDNPQYYALWARCTCGDDGLREGLAGAVATAIATTNTASVRLAA